MNIFKRLFGKHDEPEREIIPEPVIEDRRSRPILEDKAEKSFINHNGELRVFSKNEAKRLLTFETDLQTEYSNYKITKTGYHDYIEKRVYLRKRYTYWQTKSGIIVCEDSDNEQTNYYVIPDNYFFNVVVDNCINNKSALSDSAYQWKLPTMNISETIISRDIPDLEYLKSMIPEL